MSVPSSAEGQFGRAIDLMQAAGWIASRDSDDLLIGIKMTPEGQLHAQILLEIFAELKRPSPEDLEDVLGVVSCYLNKAPMVFAISTSGTGFTNVHDFNGFNGGLSRFSPYAGVILSGDTQPRSLHYRRAPQKQIPTSPCPRRDPSETPNKEPPKNPQYGKPDRDI